MKADLLESMSEGVETASVVIAFCTKSYQLSPNCQMELKYANDQKIPILPIICDKSYTQQQTGTSVKNPAKWPSSWLGTLIAGKVYVDFRDENLGCFEKLKEMIVKINSLPIQSPEKESVVEVASRDIEELRRIKEIMTGAIRRMNHANDRIVEFKQNKQSLVKNDGVKQDFGTQNGNRNLQCSCHFLPPLELTGACQTYN